MLELRLWDLHLVVLVLQRLPFYPIRDLSLLSCKVAFIFAIASIRRVSELVAVGSQKGARCSRFTIARWIRQIITQSYDLKCRVAPFSVKTHSSKSFCASWTFYHQVFKFSGDFYFGSV